MSNKKTSSVTYRIAKAVDMKAIALLSWELHTDPVACGEYETVEERYNIHMEEFCDENYEFFIALIGEEPVGFSQVSYRREYVDGTDGIGTTGYLEAIYTRKNYRNQGVARQLVTMGQLWAKSRGCKEFASGCLIDNYDSYMFHLRYGFEETSRNICFAIRL